MRSSKEDPKDERIIRRDENGMYVAVPPIRVKDQKTGEFIEPDSEVEHKLYLN